MALTLILLHPSPYHTIYNPSFNEQIIAKSAFVKITEENVEPTRWWDGTLLSRNEADDSNGSPPPLYIGWEWPSNTCPYYRTSYKQRARRFTIKDQHSLGHGSIYRPLYEKLKRSMLIPNESHALPNSHPFYRMVPSFFHTLVRLKELGITYTLVFRTFGSDLDDIASALRDFANGKHPQFPDFREPRLKLEECSMFRGRYRRRDNVVSESSKSQEEYDLFDWNNSNVKVASGDDELLTIVENLSVCGIQDDYEYWASNRCSPMAGKPVWIQAPEQIRDGGHSKHHHLFFDDNIHNDAYDSIVAVRSKEESGSWRSLNGHETIEMQRKHVVRVPTVAALLQQDWFLQQIAFSSHLRQNM